MALEIGLLAAIVFGLIEIAKRVGMPSKFAPALAVVLGILLNWLSGWQGVGNVIVGGIIAGLSAVGLFSGTKNTYRAFKK